MKALLLAFFLGLGMFQVQAQPKSDLNILEHLVAMEKLPISGSEIAMTTDPCEFLKIYRWSASKGHGHIVIRSLGCYSIEMIGFGGDQHGIMGAVGRNYHYQDLAEEAKLFLDYLTTQPKPKNEDFVIEEVFLQRGEKAEPILNPKKWDTSGLRKK